MAEEKFRLPRSSYEEICKIVKAYGRLSKPSSLDDVAQYCAINKTGISANNAFLSNVEIIEGARSKEPTEKGRALAQALEHQIPDEITSRWASIVSDNDFLNRMSAAVRIRGKMDVSALEAHIAYSAGETKSSQVMTGARAVVDILRAAGLVHEQDGQLSPVQSKSPSVVPEERTSPQQAIPIMAVDTGTSVRANWGAPGHERVSVHIELRIDATPSDLDGLGEKIRLLLQELRGGPQTAAKDDDADS